MTCLHDRTTDAHLLVLADGMGGDGAGALAADGVMVAARRLWQRGDWRQQAGPLFLEALCQEAHAELCRRGSALDSGEPHATVVALLLRGDRACWAHVGDSRLYHFRGRRCLGRTEDHSLAQWRLQHGEIADTDGESDQQTLLRGLGGHAPPEVEHGTAPLHAGVRFALCSDGVWAHLRADELGRLLRRRDLDAALTEALETAVRRGGAGADNASLILVSRDRDPGLPHWLKRLWQPRHVLAADTAQRVDGERFRMLRWPLLAGLVCLAACAPLQSLRKHLDGHAQTPAAAASAAAPKPAPLVPAPPPPAPKSLATILDKDLQYGHYQRGRADLQRLLQAHPDNRAARAILRQLERDPATLLGHTSVAHTVRPGESYSTLAAHYLGSASLFVALARYNHARDPSKLQVGAVVRIPTDVPGLHHHPLRRSSHTASAAERAAVLQRQSVALQKAGHHQRALHALGQALTLAPRLKADGATAATLRRQLLSSYHQQAIVLYRDQHLDSAIALWNRVLAIDPGYEAARVYRARALELKQRLNQL